MRVLLVTHEVSRTGAPRVALLVSRALVEQGHDVQVTTRSTGPLLPDFRAKTRTSVEPLWRLRRKLRTFRVAAWLAFLLDTAVATAAILAGRAEVVYVNSAAGAIYLRPAKWLHRGVILHIHESGQLASWFLGKAHATELLSGAHVVACSPSVQQDIASILGVPSASVSILPSVPDDKMVLRMSIEGADQYYAAKELVVGCCGTVEHRKGADLWVDVARQVIRALPDFAVRFVWVGDGTPPDLEPDEALKIAFVGPSPNPYAHMAHFDLLTLPSRDDPFPLVVLEAMLLGTPVVAFAVGGVSTQLGEAGVVVPAGDVPSFAAQIVRLLCDVDERRRLGLAAQDRVKALYSTEAFKEGLSELLATV